MRNLILFFCLITVLIQAQIHGVSPNDQEKYKGKEFTCFDGSKSITIESVNDVS